jgi:hypothetical protein
LILKASLRVLKTSIDFKAFLVTQALLGVNFNTFENIARYYFLLMHG